MTIIHPIHFDSDTSKDIHFIFYIRIRFIFVMIHTNINTAIIRHINKKYLFLCTNHLAEDELILCITNISVISIHSILDDINHFICKCVIYDNFREKVHNTLINIAI